MKALFFFVRSRAYFFKVVTAQNANGSTFDRAPDSPFVGSRRIRNAGYLGEDIDADGNNADLKHHLDSVRRRRFHPNTEIARCAGAAMNGERVRADGNLTPSAGKGA